MVEENKMPAPVTLSYPAKFDDLFKAPKPADYIRGGYSFEEGEVFFVVPFGWGGVSDFGISCKNHPGCVVIKQRRCRRPVTMVPGTTSPREEESNFFPEYPLWQVGNQRKSQAGGAFAYLYATPVARKDLCRFHGVMECRDIERLLKAIAEKRGPRWRENHA